MKYHLKPNALHVERYSLIKVKPMTIIDEISNIFIRENLDCRSVLMILKELETNTLLELFSLINETPKND